MSRYLVSLLGELVIPNLLLIKTLENVDQYVFICPKSGGERDQVRRVCAVCQIEDPVILEVDEFSLEDIDRGLKSQLGSAGAEYWVNLTGGSRILALATFDHFHKSNDAHILYLPPGKNSFQQLWPSHVENQLGVTYRLGLDDCLQAHGVQVLLKSQQLRDMNQLEAMFNIITQNSNSHFMSRLNRLGAEPKSANEEMNMTQLSSRFSRALGISPHEVLHPGWLSFIKGAWFEEYMAHWVGRLISAAYHGVAIEKDGVQNELDCAFMHENQLHIMELKASANLNDMNEFLYKLDSLGRDFGLRPRCHLVIADPDVENGLRQAPQILRRARSMGINVLVYRQLLPRNIEETLRGVLELK